ncbi:hypothetical protein [Ancylomarina sp.]|uniref:hypothetical protein n=1 Tax=Ancylomarina sp. TaxID=1970196 RepID=UPI00356A1C2C
MVQIPVKKSFIETNVVGFSTKRENFLEKAPQLIADGILPKEATEAVIKLLQDDRTRLNQKNMDQKTAHDSQIIYSKGHCPVEKGLREYKKIIDETPGISPETKIELGLVDENSNESTNNKKPDLKGREIGGSPHLSFTKYPMEGIMLYGKINDGPYDFQTSVRGSSFDDTRPRVNPKLTEVREYYAYYIYKGIKVGKQSEIVRIVLPPIE